MGRSKETTDVRCVLLNCFKTSVQFEFYLNSELLFSKHGFSGQFDLLFNSYLEGEWMYSSKETTDSVCAQLFQG